jgi:hypothetical protein
MRIIEWIGMGQAAYPELDDQNALGIELEYEQVTNTEAWASPHWVATSDGSLRNRGVELVSRPLAFGSVEDALSDAETMVASSGALATERCGLHTHMNMRPYSVGQIWSLGCLYGIIEPTLYQTYALRREDSMFAVPLWLNTGQVDALRRDITSIRNMREGAHMPPCSIVQTSKYSALNFASLASFGTLEMRQPYCSNDFEAIRSWTDFCQRLIEVGTSWEDPNEVLDYYARGSLDEIQERMFGVVVDIDPDIQEQADDAAFLIAGHTEPEWDELNWELETA